MKESTFQFSNPKLVELEFSINENFDKTLFDGFSMVNQIEKSLSSYENEAVVSLQLMIGDKSKEYPFFIKIKNLARFKCNSKELFDKLIEINAPALLLSYIRPIVSSITSQAGFKSFDIPFMDFTEQLRQ